MPSEKAQPLTADEIEAIIPHALRAGDLEGVEACIRLLVIVDPRRAADVFDTLRLGVRLAGRQ